jgi:arylsulfatase A-like enzyme
MSRPLNALRPVSLCICLVVSVLASWSFCQAGNVLVVLVDDVGVDMIGAYGEGSDPATTTFIDALAADGVRFNNAWATPVCTPSRGAIQTGRYPFRTGTRDLSFDSTSATTSSLPRCELTIPEVLSLSGAGGAAHAAMGKWHLGGNLAGGKLAPNEAGYGHFVGGMLSPTGQLSNLNNFYSWTKVVDGTTSSTTTYATSDAFAEAKSWIQARGSQPWFLYLALHAPHSGSLGYQAPPSETPPLYTTTLNEGALMTGRTCDGTTNPARLCYKAALEAVDELLERLIDDIDPQLENTTVIVMGDNGTPGDVFTPSNSKAKGTLYEGGINVPLIIGGAQVSTNHHTSDALVHSVDLFSTVIELISGASPEEIIDAEDLPVLDSKSLVPILGGDHTGTFRSIVYTQYGDDFALRKDKYKLIHNDDGTPADYELYNLQTDPGETNNIYPGNGAAGSARAAMLDYVDSLTSVVDDCDGDGDATPGFPPPADNCDEHFNTDQADSDSDGVGNLCDNCPNDSNASQVFVGSPAVSVVSPNGGDSLTIDDTVSLQWSATDTCGGVTTVDVLVSRNGVNGTYELILNDTPNDGTQAWTVTSPASGGFNAFMKVVGVDPGGNTGSDVSDSAFRIKQCGPCQVSYCFDVGVRCTWNDTCGAGGCCSYSCASDPTCSTADSCPTGACACN